jgi:hypothetical protein
MDPPLVLRRTDGMRPTTRNTYVYDLIQLERTQKYQWMNKNAPEKTIVELLFIINNTAKCYEKMVHNKHIGLNVLRDYTRNNLLYFIELHQRFPGKKRVVENNKITKKIELTDTSTSKKLYCTIINTNGE